jgi:hypothetical protein
VLFRGFDYPRSNSFYHVPIVLNFAGSEEGPHDVFHDSLERFVTFLWPALRLVSSEANIYWWFLTVHVVFRFLSILVIWRIAVFFGGNGVMSALVASLVLFLSNFSSMTPVGWSELLVGYLTHSVVVIPIVLTSWLLLYKERYFLSALAAGLAFNVNAFMGVWAAVVAGAGTIVALRESRSRIVKTAPAMVGLFVAGALPTLIWILRVTLDIAPHEPFSYRQYLREFFPYHTFVDSDWQRSISFALAVGIGFALVRHISTTLTRARSEAILTTFITLVGVIVLGALLPFVVDIRLLLNLFPLRMSTYLIIVVWILLAVWCLQALQGESKSDKALSLIALFSLANGNSVVLAAALILATHGRSSARSTNMALRALVLALALVHVLFERQPHLVEVDGAKALALTAVQTVMVVVALPSGTTYMRNSMLLIAACFVGAVPVSEGLLSQLALGFAYLCILSELMRIGRAKLMTALLALSVLLVGAAAGMLPLVVGATVVSLPFILTLFRRWHTGRALPSAHGYYQLVLSAACVSFLLLSIIQYVYRGSLAANPRPVAALTEVSQWARDQTSPHTMFLAVGVSNFSIESRRPVWIDWKYGATVMWAPELHHLWKERWPEVHDIRTVADALTVARKHGIEFIVLRERKLPVDSAPPDCVLFRNSMYWIMRTCSNA